MSIRNYIFGGAMALAILGQSTGAEPAANTTQNSKSWWNSLTGKKEKQPEPEVKDKESIQKSVVGEQSRKVLHREEKAYFRRLESSDRLMQIAVKNNDMEMQNKLLDLQEKIQNVYTRKTSNLQLPVNLSGNQGISDLETNLSNDASSLLSKPENNTPKNTSAQRKDK